MVNPIDDKAPKNYLSDEKALKRFVRQMIKNHYFIGSYLEKRYVPHLNCYKKIIKISKNDEIFIENLSIIKRRLENFYQNSKWIGITTDTPGAPVGFNIWVNIDEEIFGAYRFRVTDVSFNEDQVLLKLETIGPCKQKLSKNLSWNKSRSLNLDDSESLMEDIDSQILTWQNCKNASVFIFLLILTLVTGSGQIIKYLLDYILKLLEVLTPIIIALFNTISKMFGYLCFLIAFLWNGGESKRRPYSFNDIRNTQRIYYQPAYPYENRYKALSYPQKSSVVITELKE